MKKKRSKIKILMLCVAFLLVAALTVQIAWGNKALEINEYVIAQEAIPQEFDGFCIAQVSDLHNDEIGKGNVKLVDMLKACKPDIIALTGDLIDSRTTDVTTALDFVEEAVKIAPCYYVSGNHEQRVPEEYQALRMGLEQAGVVVLDDEKVRLFRGDSFITLAGVKDPSFDEDVYLSNSEVMSQKLDALLSQDDGCTVLLSHRPELFELYCGYEVALVLTGHAHGGQFRLPFIGGLYAPDQGLFPEYEEGLFSENGTVMIVSRGVGNSLFPFRFNNRPEIVVAKLQSK